MIWRIGAILLSVTGHYFWLSVNTDQAKPLLDGGAQAAPLALSVSIAVLQPAALPKQPKPKQPPKNITTKPLDPQKIKAPLPSDQVKNPEVPETITVQQEVEQEEKRVEETEPQQNQPAVSSIATAMLESQNNSASLPIVREPKFRRQPLPPVYPKLALRSRQQGEALIHALVNQQGNTEKVELFRSSGFALLDRSALRAVSGWAFEAARINGAPVKAWVEIPVAFQIN